MRLIDGGHSRVTPITELQRKLHLSCACLIVCLSFFFLITGGSEDAKTSYLNGHTCQRCLWSVLGDWQDQLPYGTVLFPYGCISLPSGIQYDGLGQFCYQSNCICFGQLSFQRKGEEDDTSSLLPHSSSSCRWTAGDGISVTQGRWHLQ